MKLKEKLKKIKNIRLKKKKNKEDTYSFKEVIFIIFFSFGIGIVTCISVVKLFTNGYISSDKNLDKFIETYKTIKANYYKDIDDNNLIENAIKGMVESVGDTYTNYSTEEETNDFLETVDGIYEGIGATVSMNENSQIYIYDMFDDSPSKKAGLEIGDIVVSVDNKTFDNSSDMANYIKSSSNKKVKFKILRNNEEKEIDVKREKVEVPSISSSIKELNNKKIGYIDISIFSSVTDSQFKKALTKLEKENISGLVIDVRSNGGGYLNVVTNIANLLLPKNKIVYKLELDGKTSVIKDKTKTKRTYPIAILINGGSASASEILASVIKESYGGFVVGTKSYGKGTVQQTSTLKDGSMIKYTIEKWLTPDGNWINEKGVEPTDLVELSDDYYQNPSEENDNQLNKALELVSQK